MFGVFRRRSETIVDSFGYRCAGFIRATGIFESLRACNYGGVRRVSAPTVVRSGNGGYRYNILYYYLDILHVDWLKD